MSERKASAHCCSLCDEEYDAEERVPYLGTCGHSLCSECLSSWVIRDCLTCKAEDAFASTEVHHELLDVITGEAREKKQIVGIEENEAEIASQTSDEATTSRASSTGSQECYEFLDEVYQTVDETPNEKLPGEKEMRKETAPPKKKEPTCPECHENYNWDNHVPLVRPCRHRLCSDCIIGQENMCWQCDPPRKQGKLSYSIHTEEIAAMAAKKTAPAKKMEMYAVQEGNIMGELLAEILNSEDRTVFKNMVNRLDPRSFVRLAATCKTMHNACFHTEGIKVVHDSLNLKVVADGSLGFILSRVPTKFPFDIRIFSSNWNTPDFYKYPFDFQLKEFVCKMRLTVNWITVFRAYLARFPSVSIRSFKTSGVMEWHPLQLFVKDFRFERLHVSESGGHWSSAASDETLEFLLNGGVKELCLGVDVDQRLILESSISYLEILGRRSITKSDIKALLKKCGNTTGNIHWLFKMAPSLFGHHSVFKTLSFAYRGPLPTQRPLTFVRSRVDNVFMILRRDGRVVTCTNAHSDHSIFFFMAEPKDYPPCLINPHVPYVI